MFFREMIFCSMGLVSRMDGDLGAALEVPLTCNEAR